MAPSKRRSSTGGTTALNGVLAIATFLGLVTVFDPASLRKDETGQNQNPVRNRLLDFSLGISLSQPQLNASLARAGKEPIIELLKEAGVPNLSPYQLDKLPRWDQIVALFGDTVTVVGKEHCEEFRRKVPTELALLGVAGLFNTGTNLLDHHLLKNVKMQNLWQVPWGKHRMNEVKWNHTAQGMTKYPKDRVLPVVMIRDPLGWLQSMCAHPYAASWRHGEHHCPNLIPTDDDRRRFQHLQETFTVTVKFDKTSHYSFDSLVHLWSQWYRQYLDADYPVLIIRFEDLVFQPAKVLEEVAACANTVLNYPLQYQLKTSKPHGSGTDYLKAVMKTADAESRTRNMTKADLEYATKNLDERLLSLFHYKVPESL